MAAVAANAPLGRTCTSQVVVAIRASSPTEVIEMHQLGLTHANYSCSKEGRWLLSQF
jgi:hypothetical protein